MTATKDGENFKPIGLDRPLRLSNLDKVFFPEDGYTKGDLIQYYASVAPVLLPHLAGRPLSMSRYPGGITGQSFYEKRAPGHQPDWMRTTPVPSDSQGGIIDFLLADSREALMWFANMACIEVHPFHSTEADLDKPTYAIFDFDPSEGATWDQVVSGAKLLEVALRQLGLKGYPKLSGSQRPSCLCPLGGGAQPQPGAAVRRRGGRLSRCGQPRGRDHGVGQAEAQGPGLRRPQPECLRSDRGLGVLGAAPARGPGGRPAHLGRSGHAPQRRRHHRQPLGETPTSRRPVRTGARGRANPRCRRSSIGDDARGVRLVFPQDSTL